MTGNAIPTRSRTIVHARDGGHCLRCGMRGNALHHRKRRRERDHPAHCPCNLITLCATDHSKVHATPDDARETGYIVSAFGNIPGSTPIRTYRGWCRLTCDGGIDFTTERE